MFPIAHGGHLPRSLLLHRHFSISDSLGVFSWELDTFPLHPLTPWADLPTSVLPAGDPTQESTEVKFPSLYVLFASTLLNRLLFFLTVNHITLSFTHFGLESSTTCTQDFLEILDGNYGDAPLRGTVSGVLSFLPVALAGFYLYSGISVCCHSRSECFQ